MTLIDYIIDIALIALVILQIRGSRLDLKTAIRPVILVAAAAAYYLRSFPLAGNDLLLYFVLGGTGLVLGAACAATTRVWRASDGHAYAKAGVIASVLWIVGVGSRFAFEEYVNHGGAASVERFSVTHHITTQNAWVTAILLMALGEVIARLIVLWVRGARTHHTGQPLHAPARESVAA